MILISNTQKIKLSHKQSIVSMENKPDYVRIDQKHQLKKRLREIRQSQPLLCAQKINLSQPTISNQLNKKSNVKLQSNSPKSQMLFQTEVLDLIYSPKAVQNNALFKKKSQNIRTFDASNFGFAVENLQRYKEQIYNFRRTNADSQNYLSPSRKTAIKAKEMISKHEQIMNKINKIKSIFKGDQLKQIQSNKKLPRYSQPAFANFNEVQSNKNKGQCVSIQKFESKPELKDISQKQKKNQSAKQYSFQEKMKKIEQQVKKCDLQNNICIQRPLTKNKLSISDFCIIKQIGKGKFGLVSIVIHRLTGSIFALKAIRKDVIQEQGIPSQVLRQIKIQFFINHGHVVKLYGIFDDNENVYLLTQYCMGGQLFKRIQQKNKSTQNQASILIKDICLGVAELHRYGVIHRDLKPENIVMSFNMAKICDFGWSVAGGTRMRQTFCGTPLYVSPQLLTGKKYNQKVDLWAIGIITFELIVGDIPFKITNERQLLKIVTQQVIYPTSMSYQAKQFISILLAKDPAQRKSIKQLLEHKFIMRGNVNINTKTISVLARSRSQEHLRN